MPYSGWALASVPFTSGRNREPSVLSCMTWSWLYVCRTRELSCHNLHATTHILCQWHQAHAWVRSIPLHWSAPYCTRPASSKECLSRKEGPCTHCQLCPTSCMPSARPGRPCRYYMAMWVLRPKMQTRLRYGESYTTERICGLQTSQCLGPIPWTRVYTTVHVLENKLATEGAKDRDEHSSLGPYIAQAPPSRCGSACET